MDGEFRHRMDASKLMRQLRRTAPGRRAVPFTERGARQAMDGAADERSECRTLKDVLQEQHAKEAQGCAGKAFDITPIRRARSAVRRLTVLALPHLPARRSGQLHPAALAPTAAAPNQGVMSCA